MSLGVTSCSDDYSVAYLYMVTAKTLPHGLINGYQIDYQSGTLLPLNDSPIDTGGRNTVGIVVAPNNKFLYTVNRDDSSVVEFAIGTDGKIYPQTTYNVTGSFATAAAIDAAGKFLYVSFTYQNAADGSQLYTPGNPGPGGISIFPINADNSLGTPTTVNAGRGPIGIATSRNNAAVYLIEQDSATSANLLGFAENPATGALTPLPGVTIKAGNVVSTGFPSGTSPSGILMNSSGTTLYVTDQVANQVAAYSIGANGVPSLLANGTVGTESTPLGMSFDPLGKYLYVVTFGANTIDGYTLGPNGEPIRSTVSASTVTGTGPTCVTTVASPAVPKPHAVYLYTSNSLSNDVTAQQINEQDGSLELIQGSPFGGSSLPSCVVTAPALPRSAFY